MKIHEKLIALSFVALSALAAQAQGSLAAAQAVLTREMPHLAPQIHLALAAGDYAGKPDGFRIVGTRGNIRVTAATVPTLLFGVNWYLKYTAHLDVSTNSSRLGNRSTLLPAVRVPIVKPALYPFRYALNENTDGYTTPYWNFDRWQHEIDILALSGFNAILIQRGNDLAVYQAFREIGYGDAAIRNWITQPAHQNWQWMGNMCCFIQPISLELMQKRAASARQIIDLLHSLGITPVLPGFWGVVPADFDKHVSGAHVVVQAGDWNGFTRPGWLDPRDPAFAKLAAAFYKAQSQLFGDTTLYDMETFQEGGDAGNVPVADGARAIQHALNAAHPGALWFMMAWQTNPKPELIEAVDRSKILIADIEQGRIPRETREEDFHGARWLFGGLWEFGGRTTMGAPLYDYAQRMPRAGTRQGSHLSGTALFTEGLDTNPFAFELYTEMAWHSQPVDLQRFAAEYARRRYGTADPHTLAAWRIILSTVYGYHADGVRTHGERDAAHESIFNAQPSLTATRNGQWSPDVMRYKAEDLKPALTHMLRADPALCESAAYRYDLTDLTRQVLANDGRRLLPLIRAAYERKDRAAFDSLTGEWMEDLDQLDALLGANEYFRLGTWLQYVPAWASSPEDLARIEYDARSILTTWGDRRASLELHEYANRDWSGLISDYYAPRWRMYFESLRESLRTGEQPKPIDWYAFGEQWNHATKDYSIPSTNDTCRKASEIARSLKLAPKEDQ